MRPPSTASDIVEAFESVRDAGAAKKPFLIAGQTSTYADVLDRTSRLTRLFADLGLVPGDRVLLASADDHALVTIFLALLRCGLTAVVADVRTGPVRFETLREIAAPRAIFVDRNRVGPWHLRPDERVIAIDSRSAGKRSLFSKLMGARAATEPSDAYPGLLAQIEPLEPPSRVDPSSDAYVLFTSGTTAVPKGVRISHRALFAHLGTIGRQFGYSADSRILDVLKLHHTDGLIQGPMMAWAHRATALRPFDFEVQRVGELLDLVYRHRVTHFVTVPTMLALISRLGDEYRDALRTGDLRATISTAGMLEAPLWRKVEERFGVRVSNVYGLTETVVGALFCGPPDDDYRIGTVGKPADCEARLVDQQGNEVAIGEVGELLLRGENLMSGYLNDAEGTAAVLVDGWLSTGDLLARDEDGFYSIRGRLKTLIITGGANVQPAEVNEALEASPDVAEAATFGEPDETFGEIVVSCVVAEPGREIVISELVDHCRGLLDPEKVPGRVHVVDVLPRTASGKVSLPELRDMIRARETSSAVADGRAISDEVLDLAARCFQVARSALSLESRSVDVEGWHSLSHLELVGAIEKRFGIAFTTAEIMKVEALSDAVEIASGKMQRQP